MNSEKCGHLFYCKNVLPLTGQENGGFIYLSNGTR